MRGYFQGIMNLIINDPEEAVSTKITGGRRLHRTESVKQSTKKSTKTSVNRVHGRCVSADLLNVTNFIPSGFQ